jgi:hypothetical protein
VLTHHSSVVLGGRMFSRETSMIHDKLKRAAPSAAVCAAVCAATAAAPG